MLHFGLNMPYYLMMLYGSMMIVLVLILRGLFRNRLPKFVFPVLWGVVLLRFLIPFSVSSPLSIFIPWNYLSPFEFTYSSDVAVTEAGTAGVVTSLVEEIPVKDYTASDVKWAQTVDYNNAISYGSASQVTLVEDESSFAYTYGGILYNDDFYLMMRILFAVYIIGLIVVVSVLGSQKFRYLGRLKGSLLIEHNEVINTILREMGMGHVLVFTSDDIASPMVCGLMNPRIYLPTQMDFQNTMLLRHILAHETMHIRRKDNWMKCIMLIVLCLNWFNPLVWLMSVCLASDLEAACDAAVLRQGGEDIRKDYAFSLLAMAVSGSRTSLLYSAFSKTEVEKRVKNILAYKKATFLAMLFTVLLMAGSMTAFASIGQAPFWTELTAFCASDLSRWGTKVSITRDIALGKNAQERAEDVVFSVLETDETGDPKVIEDRIQTALAQEFGVERGAFHVETSLIISDKSLQEEYESYGLSAAGGDASWTYQGEKLRTYKDEMIGRYYSSEEGTVDVYVQRNDRGEIISVDAWHEGDSEYDKRTREYERAKYSWSESSATENADTAHKIEQTAGDSTTYAY